MQITFNTSHRQWAAGYGTSIWTWGPVEGITNTNDTFLRPTTAVPIRASVTSAVPQRTNTATPGTSAPTGATQPVR